MQYFLDASQELSFNPLNDLELNSPAGNLLTVVEQRESEKSGNHSRTGTTSNSRSVQLNGTPLDVHECINRQFPK